MSAADVKKAYDDWQAIEKRFGEKHPKTLNYFSYYILVKHNNGEESDSQIAEFMARLENYKDWKNSDISFALAGVAYVLYSKDKSDSAYPLIRRAVAIAEYLSSFNGGSTFMYCAASSCTRRRSPMMKSCINTI